MAIHVGECDAMTGGVPAADEIGLKLGPLFECLRALEFGPARIANLVDGLNADHIRPEHIQRLIGSLPPNVSDAAQYFRDVVDQIGRLSDDIFFKRPSPPSGDLPIALVLPLSILDEGANYHLFSDTYIEDSKALRTVPDPESPFPDADELVNFLDYVREGLASGLARGLGGPGRVVFVTPVNPIWDSLTAGRFATEDSRFIDPGPAQDVCDYLGLPYRSTWLVELRSRSSLNELVGRERLSLAAPTVIEAWGHNFFRHWPRGADSDSWGRTLRMENGSVARDPLGLPEAIVNQLSTHLLSQGFDVSILGRVPKARRIPQHDAICRYLMESRAWSALMLDIAKRVARLEL